MIYVVYYNVQYTLQAIYNFDDTIYYYVVGYVLW